MLSNKRSISGRFPYAYLVRRWFDGRDRLHTGSKYTAKWTLAFHDLTGKAMAAHIHTGKPGKAAAMNASLDSLMSNTATH